MKITFFLFFFFFSISFYSQNKIQEKKDSLLSYLHKIDNKKLPQEVKEGYAKKATLLLKPLNDSLKFKTNIKIALMYFRKRKLDSLKKYSFYAKENAEKLKDLHKIQKSHFYLATYYKHKNIPDSAYYHYNSSINILLKQKDTITAGRRMLNVAVVQLAEKDLLGSEITTITSLKYLEKSNLNKIKADLYNNLGLISKVRKDHKEALKYFNVSLSYLNKCKITDDVIKSILNYYINANLTHQLKREYKKANKIIKKGLKKFDSIEEKFPIRYALLLQNKTFNNYYLKNEKNLLYNYNKVLDIGKKEESNSLAISTNNLLALYFENKGNKEKALFHAKKGLEISKKAKVSYWTLKILKLLSNITKGETAKKYLRANISEAITLKPLERA